MLAFKILILKILEMHLCRSHAKVFYYLSRFAHYPHFTDFSTATQNKTCQELNGQAHMSNKRMLPKLELEFGL